MLSVMNAPAMDTPTDFHFLERRMIFMFPQATAVGKIVLARRTRFWERNRNVLNSRDRWPKTVREVALSET
jgi:hypothetical protein